MANKPTKSYRIGRVSVDIWDGQYGPSVTIQKSYKDKQSGEWKRTGNFDVADAVAVAACLDLAINDMIRNPGQRNASESSGDEPVPF